MKPADRPKSRTARKLMSDEKKMQAQVSQMSGPQFDRAFVRWMADDHRKALQLVQVARGTCEEAALCTVLDKTLPVLQAHKPEARALQPPAAQAPRTPQIPTPPRPPSPHTYSPL